MSIGLKKKLEDQGKVKIDEGLAQQVTQVEAAKKQKNIFQQMAHSDAESEEEIQKEEVVEVKQSITKPKKQKRQRQKKNKEQLEEDEELQILDQLQQEQAVENLTQVIDDGPLRIILPRLNYNKELQTYFKNSKLTTGKQQKQQKPKIHKNYYMTYNEEIRTMLPDKFELVNKSLNEQIIILFLVKDYNYVNQKCHKHTHESRENIKMLRIHSILNRYSIFCNCIHFMLMLSLMSLNSLDLKVIISKPMKFLKKLLFIFEDSLGYGFHGFFLESRPKIELIYNDHSKTFMMSLFKFTDVLGKKGCYKAALEFSKILLKLCPTSDYTGALLLIDYHILRTQEYELLFKFVRDYCLDVYSSKRFSLLFMPNYIYNLAQAKFNQLSIQERQSVGLEFNQDDFDEAINNFGEDAVNANHKVLIIQAILLYPSVLIELANASEFTKQNVPNYSAFICNQRKTFKDLLTDDFLKRDTYLHWFLGIENNDDQDGLKKIIQIFPERNKQLWKTQETLQWVKGALGLILNNSDFDFEQFYQKLAIIPEKVTNQIPFQFRRYKDLLKTHFTDSNERLDFQNLFADNIGAQQQHQQQQPANFNPLNQQHGLLGAVLGTLLPWVHHPDAQ